MIIQEVQRVTDIEIGKKRARKRLSQREIQVENVVKSYTKRH